MHAVIRRYNTYEGSAAAIIEKVNRDLLPQLTQAPGFVSYFVSDPGDGTLVSVSVFEDRAGADESNRMATTWVRANLGHQIKTAPVIIAGQVVAHAGVGALK